MTFTMPYYFFRNLRSLRSLSGFLFTALFSTLFTLSAFNINALCAAEPHAKYAASLPPSAKLDYSIRASIKSLILEGSSFINWEKNGDKYKLLSETRTALTGTLLTEKSEGSQNRAGLSPEIFFSKRFRKDGLTTQFDQKTHQLIFTGNAAPLPLHGGEQDRLSVIWQLLSVGRAAPEKFIPGARFTFFVAGTHDAEPWVFEIMQSQRLRTGLGEIDAMQIIRMPEQNANTSRMEIWLAPTLEWLPIRLRISENNGDYIEQSLENLEKK